MKRIALFFVSLIMLGMLYSSCKTHRSAYGHYYNHPKSWRDS